MIKTKATEMTKYDRCINLTNSGHCVYVYQQNLVLKCSVLYSTHMAQPVGQNRKP